MCKLRKALCGLKQAPRAWYSKLSTRLHELGFVCSKADTSLFIFNRDGLVIYMLIYVDDIIIASTSSEVVDNLIHKLSIDFAVKDLSKLQYFLGIETMSHKQGLLLTHRKYILELLQKTNMQDCRPVATPMIASEKMEHFSVMISIEAQ